MTHDNMELTQKRTAYPIRVAILEEHLLHAEQNAEQMAAPQHEAIQEPAILTTGVAMRGTDNIAPIVWCVVNVNVNGEGEGLGRAVRR